MRRPMGTKKLSRHFRRNPTPAEQTLWNHLRDRQLEGFKFRRQHPIGAYVVDFYCPETSLIVELDGGGHLEKEAEDQERSKWLEARGLLVLRFWNPDVMENLVEVLEAILSGCKARKKTTPHPDPLPAPS